MFDDTPTPGEEVTPTETVDLTALTEPELVTRFETLTAEIDGLLAEPLTVARSTRINELRTERNETAQAVNVLRTDTPAETIELAERPAPVEPEAPAEPAAETDTDPTTTPEGTAPAATEDTITPQEAPVSDTNDQPEGSAEALEAAAAIVDNAASELAVTAGAGRPTAPSVPAKAVVAYTAGAGQRAFSQGQDLTWDSLARAWDSCRNLRPGTDGAQAQAVVAGLPAFEDTEGLGVELLTVGNGVEKNDRLIADSVDVWRLRRTGQEIPAHVAAICEPLDIIREIPSCGETDTPFTDIFPQRPIGRLGFTFTRGSSAAAVDGAITLIDIDDFEAQLDEGDVETWKPCIPINCATPATVTAEELVTCVSVQTSTEMSSPERVQEFMHKLRVQRARRREQIQLARFDVTASGYNFSGHNGYGSLPSLVEAVETLMPQLAYPERLDETDWDIVFEPGFINKLTIDRHNVCNPVDIAAARAETESWLRTYLGRPLVFLRDFKGTSPFQAIPAANSEVNLAALPATDRIRLVPAGAYIYGSTGEEATGWQTDPQLVRQNRKQAFTAEYFLLAKHGCHPAAYIDLTSVPDGGRGGCSPSYGYVDGGS